MKKYPPISRREYRPTGITSNFLETIEDEPEYSDEDDLVTERPSSLKRRRPLEDEEEVRHNLCCLMVTLHVSQRLL